SRRNRKTMPRHQRNDQAGGGSQPPLLVCELIRHGLADRLTRGDIHDPVVQAHLITVPEVRMRPDLRLATIYVMPLGGRDVDAVIDALDRNKRYVRGEIARRVNLKFALKFDSAPTSDSTKQNGSRSFCEHLQSNATLTAR